MLQFMRVFFVCCNKCNDATASARRCICFFSGNTENAPRRKQEARYFVTFDKQVYLFAMQQSYKAPFWRKNFALSDRSGAGEEEGDVFKMFAFRHAEIDEDNQYKRGSLAAIISCYSRKSLLIGNFLTQPHSFKAIFQEE